MSHVSPGENASRKSTFGRTLHERSAAVKSTGNVPAAAACDPASGGDGLDVADLADDYNIALIRGQLLSDVSLDTHQLR